MDTRRHPNGAGPLLMLGVGMAGHVFLVLSGLPVAAALMDRPLGAFAGDAAVRIYVYAALALGSIGVTAVLGALMLGRPRASVLPLVGNAALLALTGLLLVHRTHSGDDAATSHLALATLAIVAYLAAIGTSAAAFALGARAASRSAIPAAGRRARKALLVGLGGTAFLVLPATKMAPTSLLALGPILSATATLTLGADAMQRAGSSPRDFSRAASHALLALAMCLAAIALAAIAAGAGAYHRALTAAAAAGDLDPSWNAARTATSVTWAYSVVLLLTALAAFGFRPEQAGLGAVAARRQLVLTAALMLGTVAAGRWELGRTLAAVDATPRPRLAGDDRKATLTKLEPDMEPEATWTTESGTDGDRDADRVPEQARREVSAASDGGIEGDAAPEATQRAPGQHRQLRLAEVDVRGPLLESDARAGLARSLPRFQQCADLAAPVDRDIVVMRFTVGHGGSVSNAEAADGSLPEAMRRCFLLALYNTGFASPSEDSAVEATFHLDP